jgi:hypothetical protein
MQFNLTRLCLQASQSILVDFARFTGPADYSVVYVSNRQAELVELTKTRLHMGMRTVILHGLTCGSGHLNEALQISIVTHVRVGFLFSIPSSTDMSRGACRLT